MSFIHIWMIHLLYYWTLRNGKWLGGFGGAPTASVTKPRPPKQFFNRCYELWSELVHGNTSLPIRERWIEPQRALSGLLRIYWRAGLLGDVPVEPIGADLATGVAGFGRAQ